MSQTTNTPKKPHRRKDARPTSPTALDPWNSTPPFTPAYVPIRTNEFRRTDPHYLTGRKMASDPRTFQQSVFWKAILFLTTLALLIFAFGIVVDWLLPTALEFTSANTVSSLSSTLNDI